MTRGRLDIVATSATLRRRLFTLVILIAGCLEVP
jgi:hypothetical protein